MNFDTIFSIVKNVNKGILIINGQYFHKQKNYTNFINMLTNKIATTIINAQQYENPLIDIYVDTTNVTLKQIDLKLIKHLVKIYSQMFPNKLNFCYFVNVNKMIKFFIKIVIPLFKKNKNQKVKIKFIKTMPNFVNLNYLHISQLEQNKHQNEM